MKNLMKTINVLTICLAVVLVAAPLLAGAQFQLPDASSGGLGGGISGETSLTGLIFTIINIALALAGLIAVLFLIIGGFRYITAGGNSDSSESAKKIILNAVIGIIVVILSFVVVRVVANTLTSTSI
jgi:hypothetical protein